MENICQTYERALAQEQVDPLILMPVFICDFLCIHPFNDGNGRMSRLLTLLLLSQNAYLIGKYISIERAIEKTQDRYYEALEAAGLHWHEGNNDPTPFISYLLQIILACYTDFEERVDIMQKQRNRATAYDILEA